MVLMARRTLIGKVMLPKQAHQVKPNNKQQGFTYIGVLVILAVMMMALGAVSEIWHSVMQREKEQELLFIGHQFRAAIGKYYAQSGNRYPASLEVLLESNDIGVTGAGAKKSRFLRKLYQDPMTSERNWGLVTGQDKKVQGIYSLSEERPFKTTGFTNADADLELAEKYSDWKFVYKPLRAQAPSGGIVSGISKWSHIFYVLSILKAQKLKNTHE